MNKISFSILFCFFFKIASSQGFDLKKYIDNLKEDTIQLDSIFVRGVSFNANRQKLLVVLGEPDSIVAPKYECGGFSDEWQSQFFFQYFYGPFNFIGSNDEYQIERIDFEKDNMLSIKYKGNILNNKTKIRDFEKLFPKSYKNRHINKDNSNIERLILLPSVISDDKLFITFKNGFLIKVEYWTPC